MTDLVILFFGLMSHVAGDGDRAAVLINAPAHTTEMRIAKSDVRTPIPSALNPVEVGDSYHIPLMKYRVTTNVGFGSPALDPSVTASSPSLTTISSCRVLKEEVQKRTDEPSIAAYFVYRGGTLSVSSYENYTGKFDVWPEARCMPRSVEWRISDARNVVLIFTHLQDLSTWMFGVNAGAQITVVNLSAEAGHFHHQYDIFKDCTGPSPLAGPSCSRAATSALKVSDVGIQSHDIECSPTNFP